MINTIYIFKSFYGKVALPFFHIFGKMGRSTHKSDVVDDVARKTVANWHKVEEVERVSNKAGKALEKACAKV